MKHGVSRSKLILTAGIVWIFAGANILRIGVIAWMGDSEYPLFKICEAIIVFLLFFMLVFRRLYYKHTRRIEAKALDENCPFSFFDVKGWSIMAFMILLGVSIRKFQLMPESFIAVFYTGLSVALIVTGMLFVLYWKKRRG